MEAKIEEVSVTPVARLQSRHDFSTCESGPGPTQKALLALNVPGMSQTGPRLESQQHHTHCSKYCAEMQYAEGINVLVTFPWKDAFAKITP